jgi:hypothetical protein
VLHSVTCLDCGSFRALVPLFKKQPIGITERKEKEKEEKQRMKGKLNAGNLTLYTFNKLYFQLSNRGVHYRR